MIRHARRPWSSLTGLLLVALLLPLVVPLAGRVRFERGSADSAGAASGGRLTSGASPWDRSFFLGGPGTDGFGCK